MHLESVAEYLQEQGVSVQGKDLFVGEMPVECQIGAILLDRYSGTPINPYLPRYRQTGFRVAVRSVDRLKCLELAEKITATLTIFAETPMSEILVKQMIPQTDPRPYRRSAGGYWECEVDFETSYVIERADLRL